MFSFKKNETHFLSKDEMGKILACVKQNEDQTSGEIRICIESHCPYMEPLERAREIFHQLNMFSTEQRNAALIYIAYEDRDFALFADKALHEKTTSSFWQTESKQLARHFYEGKRVDGIVQCIQAIGSCMSRFFPPTAHPKNELPDEIIFGK